MLVPLNRPVMPPKQLGLRVKILNGVIRSIEFVFKVCFGWIGWILSRSYERKFAAEVRRELCFLFEEYGAQVVPSKKSRHAITLIVEFGVVRLRISRHHTEIAFSVASVFAPDHFETFQLIVNRVTTWNSTRSISFPADLDTFAPILRKSIPLLQEALSKDNVHSTLSKAIEAENRSVDAYAERARANGVEPIISSSPTINKF